MYAARRLLSVTLFALFAIAASAIASGAADPAPSKVVVHVTDASGNPVAGQTIYLTKQDGSFWDIFSATSDVAGNAVFSDPLSAGTWIIEKHQGFGGAWKDARGSIVVTDGNHNYQVSLPLTRSGSRISYTPPKPPGERGLAIRVQGRGPSGLVPVHYAAIYDTRGREIAMTGYDGRANVRHDLPLGEMYELKAEANHWQTGTSSFTVGAAEAGNRLTLANDYINFVLDPAQAAPNLTIEVLDHETNKPVASASVTLYKPNKFPGTSVASKGTNAKGEAVFNSDSVNEALLQGNARVGVTASGYTNAVQDVTAELFAQAEKYTNKDARYVVYLKPSSNVNWNGTFIDGTTVVTLSGSATSLTGTSKWTNPGETFAVHGSSGTFAGCTVNGARAQCTSGPGEYHDADKTIATNGNSVLTLSGNTLTIVTTLTTANASWHVAPYASAVHVGAVFTSTLKRLER